MRGLSFLVALLLWPLAALAQDRPRLDPDRLAPQDIRHLQAALVWSGVYLRSALVDGVAVPMQVAREPWQKPRADLIASSMPWGTAPDLAPRPGGAREAVMVRPPAPPDLSRLPGQPQPPPKVVPPLAPATALVGTGTGSYVNDTDIVTAAQVVEDCREMRLEDGSALRLLGSDPQFDLAVLAAEHRSESRLPIGAAGPRLGEPVLALGFPV